VVAKVTSFLFVQRASIEGLEEKVARGQFGMTIQASWSKKDCDVSGIRKGLTAVARAGMALSEIIAAGQKLEAKTLVKAIKLYLTKRLDVYWGAVQEV
jgi:predicted amino acid-binding ACT domain protein